MDHSPLHRRGALASRVSKRVLWTIVLAVTLLTFVIGQVAKAAPPNIPSKATAQSELNALTIATEGSMTGYSRDLFPHWITISGTCNARETVLKRDGSGVAVGGDCNPTSGSWFSQYDGVTLTASSGVDIDHVIPLAEAWRSGASAWATSTRQSFANDLSRPQLIAVGAGRDRAPVHRYGAAGVPWPAPFSSAAAPGTFSNPQRKLSGSETGRDPAKPPLSPLS